jgi:hypothetical protein
MDTEFKYPELFVDMLKEKFPDDHEIHQLAIDNKYCVGRLLIDRMKQYPNQKQAYYSTFQCWCGLSVVKDMTTQIILS